MIWINITVYIANTCMPQDSLWGLATRLIYSTPNPHCASLKISIYNLKRNNTLLQIICKQNSKIGLLRIANCLDIFLLRFAMRWTPCLLATLREFFITNTQSSPTKISYCHIFKHIQKGKHLQFHWFSSKCRQVAVELESELAIPQSGSNSPYIVAWYSIENFPWKIFIQACVKINLSTTQTGSNFLYFWRLVWKFPWHNLMFWIFTILLFDDKVLKLSFQL